jgi:DNA processing protein
MVAIVGSRRATPYGLRVARLLGEELGAARVPVVSGMARGIDAEAHQGALASDGATIAVWGTGPDRIYPPEHGRLADTIAIKGALLTEYPPGTPPRRYHFPERNRLIAGMATAVVVVEAASKSGALVTARLALDENREVLAVPGSIFSELSAGPNAMIRVGARPLLSLRDVFDSLSHPPAIHEEDPGSESELLGLIGDERALSVDELAECSGRPAAGLHAELLELELCGAVQRLPDGRYRRH